jgi:hypothetical protein
MVRFIKPPFTGLGRKDGKSSEDVDERLEFKSDAKSGGGGSRGGVKAVLWGLDEFSVLLPDGCDK